MEPPAFVPHRRFVCCSGQSIFTCLRRCQMRFRWPAPHQKRGPCQDDDLSSASLQSISHQRQLSCLTAGGVSETTPQHSAMATTRGLASGCAALGGRSLRSLSLPCWWGPWPRSWAPGLSTYRNSAHFLTCATAHPQPSPDRIGSLEPHSLAGPWRATELPCATTPWLGCF